MNERTMVLLQTLKTQQYQVINQNEVPTLKGLFQAIQSLQKSTNIDTLARLGFFKTIWPLNIWFFLVFWFKKSSDYIQLLNLVVIFAFNTSNKFQIIDFTMLAKVSS